MIGARRWLAASVVAVAAFLLYDTTLLPGQDLGDTASFQATLGDTVITPRQAYPLYYATGNLFVWAVPGEPARAANLASAFFAAAACGLLTLAVAQLSGSAIAGAVTGLSLGASYTFWSQAIIAEVYGLHAFMMAACLVALLAWAASPATWRLALFFGLYAAGFGNHLMMVLLLPGCALFLLLGAPGGARALLRPRVVALAALMAALGASQYLWNFSYLLAVPNRPEGFLELLRTFWFDVTKTDWRSTMVMAIPEPRLHDRAAMWWFDVRQQFGVPGVLLAAVGLVWMLAPDRLPGRLQRLARPRVGAALFAMFLVCWLFAFTYNVGDAHVFYLPAHVLTAVFAGLGAAAVLTWCHSVARRWLARSAAHASVVCPAVVAALLLALPLWRTYDNYPALDRSRDWRPKQFFDRLTTDLSGFNAVLASDLNWQLHNGLDYYEKVTRPDLPVLATPEALLYFPFIVRDNRAIGRTVAMTSGARMLVEAAYGPLFAISRDARVRAQSFSDRIARQPLGTPYVLTVLSQYPDLPIDVQDFQTALARLSGGAVRLQPSARYNVIAGRIGARPTLMRSATRPFRVVGSAAGVGVEARMECWLPADTIRRMGFGAIIVGRRSVLTIDRGVSFVALDEDGTAKAVEYGWGIFAPQPRWLLEPGPSEVQPRSSKSAVSISSSRFIDFGRAVDRAPGRAVGQARPDVRTSEFGQAAREVRRGIVGR